MSSPIVTSAPAGVVSYEWSPDGKFVAYVSRDAGDGRPPVANKVGSQSAGHARCGCNRCPQGQPRAVTPPDQFVDSLSWSPDSREIAYSFAPFVGFLAPYSSKIFAVTVASGAIRPIVDRAGHEHVAAVFA